MNSSISFEPCEKILERSNQRCKQLHIFGFVVKHICEINSLRIYWIFCGLPKRHILLIRPFTHILMENIAVFVMICIVEAKEWNNDKSNLACIIASTSIDIVIPNTQNMIFVCTLMSCQMQQHASIIYRLLFLFSISSISFECWYIDSQT